MNGFVQHSKRVRPRKFSRIDGTIHLNVPSEDSFKKTILLLVLLLILVIATVFHCTSKVLHSASIDHDQVQIVQAVVPPVQAVQQVKLAPKPSPPRPDPDQTSPSLQKKGAPPPPVFGLPEAATNEAGDMAVATGNTLMTQADSVVQKPSLPLSTVPERLDKQPAVLDQVIPEYPAWAEEQGVTATVQLQVIIDGNGRVQSVSVVKPGGNDFDRNAIKAVKATRFQPYIKDGVALPAQFLFTYSFVL